MVSCDRLIPRRGEKPTAVRIRVRAPDLEWRRPEADHATLELLTSSTGGKLLDLDDLTEEFAQIPDRKLQIPDDLVEPLWDSKLMLLLFVGLVTAEWVLRKMFGLV